MSDSSDADLLLKKRARRRLVGAVAFAGLAAVVLPMVMDDEPKQQVQDVQIRIPGQDQTPFNPKLAKPAAAPVAEKSEPSAPAAPRADEKTAEKKAEKPVEKAAEHAAEKPAAEKQPARPAEKPSVAASSEAQRAAAILAGKTVAPAGAATPAVANGQFVILIGAFANPANVKQLQAKISELGVKVYTEPLESPEGVKTRVRAGPFTNREAADKALEKMKRIGVNGVIAAKQ